MSHPPLISNAVYKKIAIDNERYYGKQLILNAATCNENMLDKDMIRQFLKEMVERIDMVAYGEAIVERFGEGIEIGISAVQLIETSSIVMHTNDGARDLYLDVFSCKSFDEDIAIAVVKEVFSPGTFHYQTLFRK